MNPPRIPGVSARFVALAFATSACVTPSAGWRVINGTPAQDEETRTLIDAAASLLGPRLPGDGFVEILAPGELDGQCGAFPRVAGCTWTNGISVVAVPDQSMLTTALGEELCHYAGIDDEQRAGACGLLVNGAAQP